MVNMAAPRGSRSASLLSYFHSSKQSVAVSEVGEEQPSVSAGHSCSQREESDSSSRSKKARKERQFKGSWRKEFVWLEYDAEKEKMFCQYCREFPHRKNEVSSFCKAFYMCNTIQHNSAAYVRLLRTCLGQLWGRLQSLLRQT